MRVDVVIPNFNGAGLLKKNLPLNIKVFENYKEIKKVIIVDDGSDPEEREKARRISAEIKSSQIDIEFLTSDKNYGFASTINKGVNFSDADLVLLLNTDAVVEKGFLEPLIEDFLKDEMLFGAGCMDKSIEGNKVILRGRGTGRWKKGFLIHRRGEVNRKDTLWVSGGSSMIRRSFFLKLGGFDELFNPFYWEDIDLSYRAVKRGYKILFDSRSMVVHRHEEGAIKKNFSRFYIKIVAFRNQFIFVWKNITDVNLIQNHLLYLPYHFIVLLLRVETTFYLGFFLALLRLPAIIRKRRTEENLSVLKDKDIIK